MTRRRAAPVLGELAQACALTRPDPGGWRWWWIDRHFVLAGLAALPAWALLGVLVGTQMRAPATAQAWLAWLVVQPLAEECVFRGLLQGALRRWTAARRVGPVTVANALATVAFVLAHLAVQPPAWALAVALPSLVFGHLRDRFASVVPAVVLHAVYNAGFAVLAASPLLRPH